MNLRFAPIVAGAMLLAGCATTRSYGPGDELAGRSARMEAQNGQVTMLDFRRDGSVRATFAGRSVTGRWQASEDSLCFFWTGAPRECWPYRDPFARGRTRTITSDRGNVVRVTLL